MRLFESSSESEVIVELYGVATHVFKWKILALVDDKNLLNWATLQNVNFSIFSIYHPNNM
jgi:hypothetical protein